MKNKFIYTLIVSFITISVNAQLDRSKAPKAQPNPGINIPKPNVFKLDNGLTVIVVENHKLPKVSFQLYVDHQPLNEGNKAGLGNMFGELLGSGTEDYPKDVFDEKIDFMGASFSSNSRGFFASSLSKHTPELLSLLSSVVLKPAFPESEFERIKKQTLSGLATTSADAKSMASNVAGIVNFGEKHPYGEVITENTINAITLNDIKDYSNVFQPNLSYLVIVGDINDTKAKDYAKTYFGNWKKGNSLKQEIPEIAKTKGNQVYFVNKPGAVQSVIKITHPVNLKPGHEDAIKLRVLNGILGGGSFSARLMANLREDKAYTYGCYSSINSDEIIGDFTAGGSFRNEVTDSAVTQILKEINLIVDEKVKDSELDLVQKSMTGAFARSLENPQTIARFALNTIRFNLPSNYYATYLQKLERITKKDLYMVANEYLSPNNLNIIVVGNEKIADKLVKFDTDGKISKKDAFGNDVVDLKQVAANVTFETVINDYLFQKFKVDSRAAIDKKLSKIGYLETEQTSFIEQMNSDLVLKTYRAKPNKSAMVMSANNGEMTIQKEWFNGEKGGSFAMMQGKKELTTEEIEKKKKNNFLSPQLYYGTNKNLNIELLGIENLNNQDYYKVKVTKLDDDEFSYEYYNVKTGMLDIEETFSKDPEGNPVNVKMYYKDYKTYGKKKTEMLIPSKTTMDMGVQKIDLDLKKVIIKKKSKSTTFDGIFK